MSLKKIEFAVFIHWWKGEGIILPYSPSLASFLILPTSLSIGEGILCILSPRSRRTGLFPTYYTPTFSFKKVRLFQHPQKDNKPLWSIFFKKGRIITITQQQGVSHFLRPRKKSVARELPCSKCEKNISEITQEYLQLHESEAIGIKYHFNR